MNNYNSVASRVRKFLPGGKVIGELAERAVSIFDKLGDAKKALTKSGKGTNQSLNKFSLFKNKEIPLYELVPQATKEMKPNELEELFKKEFVSVYGDKLSGNDAINGQLAQTLLLDKLDKAEEAATILGVNPSEYSVQELLQLIDYEYPSFEKLMEKRAGVFGEIKEKGAKEISELAKGFDPGRIRGYENIDKGLDAQQLKQLIIDDLDGEYLNISELQDLLKLNEEIAGANASQYKSVQKAIQDLPKSGKLRVKVTNKGESHFEKNRANEITAYVINVDDLIKNKNAGRDSIKSYALHEILGHGTESSFYGTTKIPDRELIEGKVPVIESLVKDGQFRQYAEELGRETEQIDQWRHLKNKGIKKPRPEVPVYDEYKAYESAKLPDAFKSTFKYIDPFEVRAVATEVKSAVVRYLKSAGVDVSYENYRSVVDGLSKEGIQQTIKQLNNGPQASSIIEALDNEKSLEAFKTILTRYIKQGGAVNYLQYCQDGGSLSGVSNILENVESKIPEAIKGKTSYKIAREAADIGTYFIPIVGEVRSAKDMVSAAKEGKYFAAALAALGVIPFMSHLRVIDKLGKSGSKLFKAGKKTEKAVEKAIKTATKEAEGMSSAEAITHVQNAAAEAATESVSKNLGSISKELETLNDIKVDKIIESNGKIRLRLDTHTKSKPREFVLEPVGDNKYRPHFRIWDGEKVKGNISNEEKEALFEAMYKALPKGGELLIPESSAEYLATKGTTGAFKRFAKDSRYAPGTEGSFLFDNNGVIEQFDTTSFIKQKLGGTLNYLNYTICGVIN